MRSGKKVPDYLPPRTQKDTLGGSCESQPDRKTSLQTVTSSAWAAGTAAATTAAAPTAETVAPRILWRAGTLMPQSPCP